MQTMKHVMRLMLVVFVAMIAAAPAYAQMGIWEDRGFVNVNGLFQIRSDVITKTEASTTIYDEKATITGAQTIKTQGATFDIGGGVRIVGNFGAGIAYTQLSTTGGAAVTASVPHPLIYDSPRTANGTATGLAHKEKQIHLFAVWMLPVSDKLDVAFSAGPTFFKLTQDIVGSATYAEVGPPYTQITMAFKTSQVTQNATGFNFGADVTYKFSRMLGAGGFVRWAATKVDVTPTGGTTMSINVGGVQCGGGLRLRF
jgi:hypothetical protein